MITFIGLYRNVDASFYSENYCNFIYQSISATVEIKHLFMQVFVQIVSIKFYGRMDVRDCCFIMQEALFCRLFFGSKIPRNKLLRLIFSKNNFQEGFFLKKTFLIFIIFKMFFLFFTFLYTIPFLILFEKDILIYIV